MEDADPTVNLFVYDEVYEGKNLVDIINQQHVNPKYLPNIRLPDNIVSILLFNTNILFNKVSVIYNLQVAVGSLIETAKYADVIIFAIPNTFVVDFCKTLLGKVKPSALGISLIKGFMTVEGGGMDLISHVINKYLKVIKYILFKKL